VHSLRSDVRFEIDDLFLFQGTFAVVSRRRGRPVSAVCHDTTLITPVPGLRPAPPAITGQITEFTRDLSPKNVLTMSVDTEVADPASVVGDYVYVENDGVRNASYRI